MLCGLCRARQKRESMVGKGPCTFRKNDIKRAIEAARAAGVDIGKIRVDQHGFELTPKSADDHESEPELDRNEWDAPP